MPVSDVRLRCQRRRGIGSEGDVKDRLQTVATIEGACLEGREIGECGAGRAQEG